ncbi:hypothetical protein FOXG_18150 [Fusarium oxysporum f. sp. lycopersici 4287]|uniref:Uncharacterized protein n=2 Tax=Fusarium oxysporum species complex TaxID=171631 RepID=A0A0J9UEB2_FUSO4|nr:hypothetical protein FOXG_18150 [Fusarium oxysporum f. sp. lycopersici 4287]XP_031070134.1 uncharacterized protein FOIG_02894 [Fusarium odoratissimum NRRL 54006]EXM08045.1 hypothetical protein FOIG_02894 [Fusarium odoratissimum NRRL 54006]KNA96440.1 hypothetical protein FOXG_18150 [Fusarium oxysporum f. sp. lycopersici 4287]
MTAEDAYERLSDGNTKMHVGRTGFEKRKENKETRVQQRSKGV